MNSVVPPRFQFETFNPREEGSTRVRTAWISDVHLGTRASGAARLLDFLREYDFQTLYVVGDLIDIWQMRRSRYWPQQHNDVIQKILRKSRKGTRVIYIPGNHDEMISSFYGAYGDITIQKHAIHRTADGRRILVIHGHELDTVVQNVKWLAFLGDAGYQFLLSLNPLINFFRRRFGLGYWSLSAYVKQRVKDAVSFIGKSETSPVRHLQLELRELRRELRTTARVYAQRLEHDLAVTRDALERYAPAEKLSREQLHRVRDIAMVVRNRRLRPEKGRRKDLRKIENIISDLRPLVSDE